MRKYRVGLQMIEDDVSPDELRLDLNTQPNLSTGE
jgi:hypothetical protein